VITSIKKDVLATVYSLLKTAFNSYSNVVVAFGALDISDYSKNYIWFSEISTETNYYDRNFVEFSIDVHVYSKSFSKATELAEIIEQELDKKNLGSHNIFSVFLTCNWLIEIFGSEQLYHYVLTFNLRNKEVE